MAFFILPIIWLILAPTKSNNQLLLDGPFSFGSFDQLVANWNELFAFGSGVFTIWLGNSVFYSFSALAITLLISIPAGYALALIQFKGRRLLLITTLIVMLIPNTALVLPIFLELSAARLIGNPLAVILPFSFFPFGVYLTYIYFSTAVSRDLLNAARIDGAGELRVFTSVALPLATPVIALVGFFSFVSNWNNYFLPFLVVGGQKIPVQVGLANLLSNVPAFNPTTSSSIVIQLPTLALATLLSVAPILIIFLFAQRFLVEGMTAAERDEGHEDHGTARSRRATTGAGRSATSTDTSRMPSPRCRSSSSRPTRASRASASARTPISIGCSPRSSAKTRVAVSALFDRMLAQVFKSGHAGATYGGVATIDAALWDIKAKLAGEPLWRLLGGRDRFVPGYASGLDIALSDDEIATFYGAFADRGYVAGKLKGGLDPDADLRRLRVLEASSPATRRDPGSCSTRTSRGRSSRPCATSARSRSTSTCCGSRSRCAVGTPSGTPG